MCEEYCLAVLNRRSSLLHLGYVCVYVQVFGYLCVYMSMCVCLCITSLMSFPGTDLKIFPAGEKYIRSNHGCVTKLCPNHREFYVI